MTYFCEFLITQWDTYFKLLESNGRSPLAYDFIYFMEFYIDLYKNSGYAIFFPSCECNGLASIRIQWKFCCNDMITFLSYKYDGHYWSKKINLLKGFFITINIIQQQLLVVF